MEFRVSRLCLTIDSILGDASFAAVAINRICTHAGMDEALASEVELCIAEALTNVIRHAYQGNSGHTISIQVETGVDRLHIEISDDGIPMPAETVDRLLHGAKLVEDDGIDRVSLPEGGRGLQIIHDLMDEVTYIRDANLNLLQLTKSFPLANTY
jgi:serine/threonine-protein kinase RsbW